MNVKKLWRKGRDSNPRWGSPHNGFQDRRNKPDSATLPQVVQGMPYQNRYATALPCRAVMP